MLTNGQKKAIHLAAKQAGIDPHADEDQYRLVLFNVGGFQSAADATASREGFIAVMAFFENRAGGQLHGCTIGYWKDQDQKYNPRDPLVWKIKQEMKQLGMNEIELNCFLASEHMSCGTYRRLEDAPTRWLCKVLNGLKAMNHRKQRKESMLW